jgi:integrase
MRRRSNGWLFKRPDARGWYIGYYVDGRKVREHAGPRKSDAAALLKRRIDELDDGRWQPPGKELTFDDLIELVRANYRAKGRRSLDRVEQCVKHLRGRFGLATARGITAERLDSYFNYRLDEGAAMSTVRNELNVLKRGMNLAVGKRLLATRPPFPEITPTNVRTGFFERHELDALLAELPERVRPVVRFLFLTGWRTGEVLSRQWRHVDLHAGTIRLEPGETKNGDGRTFPFTALPELHAVLTQQRVYTDAVERRTGEIVRWVFHREGRPIKSFRTAWRGACRRLSLDRIPHDFRRTAVRNLNRAGVPRSVAKALVGHKTDSVYNRYSIANEDDLREGVEKLARLGRDRRILRLPEPDPNRTRQAVSGARS